MIPLFWFKKYDNFGDRLSETVVRAVSGRPVRYANTGRKLLALGSVAHFAGRGDHLWGTGVRDADRQPETSVTIHAVRGPDSRRYFLDHGIDCPAVYGDPALLLPYYYIPKVGKKQGLVALPHYRDRWPIDEGIEWLSVRDDPFALIDRIASSEILVTGSLHGLIVAEAYGVPAILLRHTCRTASEHHFKFVDYFHSTDREDGTIWDVDVRKAAKHRLPPPRFPDPARLLAAFPHGVFGSPQVDAAE